MTVLDAREKKQISQKSTHSYSYLRENGTCTASKLVLHLGTKIMSILQLFL